MASPFLQQNTVCRKVFQALKLLLCSAVSMPVGWLLLVGWLQFGWHLQLFGVQWILRGFSENLTWNLHSHPKQMPRTNLISWAFLHTPSRTLPHLYYIPKESQSSMLAKTFVSTEELFLLHWASCELFRCSFQSSFPFQRFLSKYMYNFHLFLAARHCFGGRRKHFSISSFWIGFTRVFRLYFPVFS